MKRTNPVLIIAGPSGAGKTVVAKAIVESDPRFTFLRSTTTRARRGDAHDDEYLYATEAEFLAAVARGEFVEYMNYGGCLYGTTKAEMNAAYERGKIPLLVLDLCGVESLYKAEGYSACSVYVYAPLSVVEGRLAARYFADGETPEAQKAYNSRRERNIVDFLSLPNYAAYFHDFLENVDSIEDCRDRVMKIFADFTDGAPTDTAKNTETAAALKATAQGR
ncbi:MAG: hypothetical protein IKL79_05670 [Clostridia bacterium]|nr:hypothetical protein [Clostridia bacterium]